MRHEPFPSRAARSGRPVLGRGAGAAHRASVAALQLAVIYRSLPAASRPNLPSRDSETGAVGPGSPTQTARSGHLSLSWAPAPAVCEKRARSEEHTSEL